VSCLGRCDRAPAAIINERLYAARTADELWNAAQQMARGETPAADSDAALEPYSSPQWKIAIDVYERRPTYETIRQYIKDPDSDRVLKALEVAGLLGMGGAGGRAYKKWDDVRVATGDRKFVVCNGDESEPGTFKDRELLLRTPHLVLEGMILGALIVGAEQGYVYLRHEYPEQKAAMDRAIADAQRQGFCGSNILGSGRRFEVETFVSPGGYICGEQSALIEAIEDHRGEPRNRPPQLQTNGLWDCPTLLNNVETFAWVPAIILRDEGKWYAASGVNEATGSRFFSISGDVAKPGVYEVPCGIKLGDLITKYAGGLKDGLKAVALSGPSGGFVPAQLVGKFLGRYAQKMKIEPDQLVSVLDLPLDVNAFRNMGLMLGAGLVVYGENADMVEQAVACSRFYRNESCGKCVPCRVGSQKTTEIAEKLLAGSYGEQELPQLSTLVNGLNQTMEITSICGLGMVASNPLMSLLKYFPEDARKCCGAS